MLSLLIPYSLLPAFSSGFFYFHFLSSCPGGSSAVQSFLGCQVSHCLTHFHNLITVAELTLGTCLCWDYLLGLGHTPQLHRLESAGYRSTHL